jgi:nucleoside phosphorylase
MVAALFIHHFKPRALIVSGTGSRFNPRIRTGDTVISLKTIHHAAGSLTSDGMVYRNVRGPLPGTMTSWFYKPDKALLARARAALKTYRPDEIAVDGETYRPRVLTGVVSASDMFGVSDEKIADMKAKLDPDIMEMESAAIAQVAQQLGTPHIVFRAGSNRTQSNPGNDYRRLGQIAARAAARWTVHFVGSLPR